MAKVVEEMKRWPKVELHCHLEGTVRLDTAWKWAQYSPSLADITFEALQRKIQFDGIRNYAHFLNKFGTLRLLYNHPEAIKEVVRQAVASAAADNVRYLELRFSPDHFARQAGHDPYDVAQLILRTGMREANKQGIMVRFLCTIGRGYDLETSNRLLDIALTFRDMGIVGLDLAGNELKHPELQYRSLFEHAAAEGLGISIHAGEAGPATRVWEAVLDLNANRIAHGIRSIDDPTLLALLSERNIACEVCPTSNLHTGVVDSPAEHPLAALVKAGVPVALSTDDPAMSRICLSDEYRFAIEEAGFTHATLADMVLTAARHAFLPAAEKEALLHELQKELSELTDLAS